MKLFLTSILMALFINAPVFSTEIQGACEEELQTYCSNVRPGEGRVADCLKRYQDRLSEECMEFLNKSSDALKNLKEACSDDAHEYCRDVKTSYRRIVHCLREHYNEVSTDCRLLLK